MNSSKVSASILPADEPMFSMQEAAEHLGVVITRVMDMLRGHELIALDRDGSTVIPQLFFTQQGEVNKFVPGLIALLADGSYNNQEIIDFLFTEDPSLPGRPIDALHGHLAREVMRRAQAMAL